VRRHRTSSIVTLSALAVLAACPAPVPIPRFEGVTPRAPDRVYAKALTVLTAFGYTVTGGDQAAGYVTGQIQIAKGDVAGAIDAWWTVRVVITPDSAGQTRFVVHPAMLAARYASGHAVVVDSIPNGGWKTHLDSLVAALAGP
jgi:hypothetical protein